MRGGKVVQKQVLYLGEINDSQREAWCRVIAAFDEGSQQTTQLALFPAERQVPEHAKGYGIQVRLDAMELHRPRQWGACWLASQLYEQLGLVQFFAARLAKSRKGTSWCQILQTLVCYRLIDPGSEWRLHRQWFERSAMADLLGEEDRLQAGDPHRILRQPPPDRQQKAVDHMKAAGGEFRDFRNLGLPGSGEDVPVRLAPLRVGQCVMGDGAGESASRSSK